MREDASLVVVFEVIKNFQNRLYIFMYVQDKDLTIMYMIHMYTHAHLCTTGLTQYVRTHYCSFGSSLTSFDSFNGAARDYFFYYCIHIFTIIPNLCICFYLPNYTIVYDYTLQPYL